MELIGTSFVLVMYTSFYHSQANPVKRINRVIKTMLVSYVSDNHREWDLLLSNISRATRSAKHEVIGHTPYFVNFGLKMTIMLSKILCVGLRISPLSIVT